MIRVADVSKRFGGVAAVDGASLEIAEGSITGLIGPNGAGKTTLFNLIAGVLAPDAGQVFLGGEDVTGLKPHELFHPRPAPDLPDRARVLHAHRAREPDDSAGPARRGRACWARGCAPESCGRRSGRTGRRPTR